MSATAREIAQAISTHDFEAALPYLADDVVWIMPGSEGLSGRENVAAACRATAAGLTGVEIVRDRLLVVDGGERVAIDTRTRYRDADGETTVASCDVYEFEGGMLARLTSYTVEV